jgi:hypothetical protein
MCYYAALLNAIRNSSKVVDITQFEIEEDNSDINMLRYESHPSPSGEC